MVVTTYGHFNQTLVYTLTNLYTILEFLFVYVSLHLGCTFGILAYEYTVPDHSLPLLFASLGSWIHHDSVVLHVIIGINPFWDQTIST